MATNINGIKSMLPARPWLKRSVERLSKGGAAGVPAAAHLPDALVQSVSISRPIAELRLDSRLALLERVDEHYASIREEMMQAVRDCRDRVVVSLAGMVLTRMGVTEVLPVLRKKLKGEIVYARLAAAEVLGRLEAKGAIPDLRETLHDPYEDVRAAAAEALGRLRAKEAIPDLGERLGDEDWQVRLAAAEALGRLEAKEAIPDLRQSMVDEYEEVRLAAALALIRLQGKEPIPDLRDSKEAIPVLIGRLEDGNDDVRAAAAKALGWRGAKEAISALLSRLGDHALDVRRTAAEALLRIEGYVVLDRISRENGHSWDVIAAVLEQLTSFEYKLAEKEADDVFWNRAFVKTVKECAEAATFLASITGSGPEKLFVRFDDPRAEETLIELDGEQDREIIEKLYPEWRVKSDLEVLEKRLAVLEELREESLDSFPGRKATLSNGHKVPAEVKQDHKQLVEAIERTRALIQMAKRGLEYYGHKF